MIKLPRSTRLSAQRQNVKLEIVRQRSLTEREVIVPDATGTQAHAAYLFRRMQNAKAYKQELLQRLGKEEFLNLLNS
jgi:hypothetical protein